MDVPVQSNYRDIDFRRRDNEDKYEELLNNSTTVYVGNLSFYTRESQIYELFSMVGPVKRVIMGLNRHDFTPCGFCFVEYFHKVHARNAVAGISKTLLDGRVIRVDIDIGFSEGRQYGRGKTGGQVRDEKRSFYDEERGGYTFQT